MTASREFKAGKYQNLLTDDNIAKIVVTYQSRKSVDKYIYLANLEEIKENNYNPNIPRYIDKFEEEKGMDLMAVTGKAGTQKTIGCTGAGNVSLTKELGYE